MQHVILAAGQGSRVFPETLKTPKVLLSIGETNLLERQIELSLSNKVIDKIVVVTGALGDSITEYIKRRYAHHDRIVAVANPHYHIHNPLYSIASAFAQLAQESSLLVTNGDIYYTKSLIESLCARVGEGIFMTVSQHLDQSNKAMTVIEEQGRFVRVYPGVAAPRSFESPGVVVVAGVHVRSLFDQAVHNLLLRYPMREHFWHDVFNDLQALVPIHLVKVRTSDWCEVDSLRDLVRARALLSTDKSKK